MDIEEDEWDCGPTVQAEVVLTASPYEIKDLEHVEKLIDDSSREISEVLKVSKDQALSILKFFKWNPTTAESTWFENPDHYGALCGVTFNPEIVKKQGKSVLLEFDSEASMCMVCFDSFTEENPGDTLQCNHKFCKNCWKGTCEAAVLKGKDCINTTCPFAGCFMQVPASFFKKYCTPSLFAKYSHFMCRSYTDDNKYIKWCPAAGCKYFANLLCGIPESITCKCGNMFCPGCGNEPHKPVTCELLMKWQEKNANEGENFLWLLANTKPCPKCKTNIEKNGGCFYMRCFKCGFEFCWSCLRSWKEHSDHWTCNLFDTELKSNKQFKDRLEAQKTAEMEIKRFGFYYEKYFSHGQGLDYAKKELTRIKDKQSIYSELVELPLNEMDFLEEAALSIVEMRSILKYSYVLGYYMGEASGKELFQFQQGCLEQFCDKLHVLIEMNPNEVVPDKLNNSSFFKYKSDVANYYGVCRKYYSAFSEASSAKFT